VLDPIKVVLTNHAEGETDWLDAPYYPHDVPLEGSRKVPFTRELYIERADFMEDPPKKFFRLAPGREVRLRYGYLITCQEVVKDAAGKVVELRCTYDPATRGGDAPDGRKVAATIHWVSAEHAVDAEVRLYDKLFAVPNPDAGEVASADADEEGDGATSEAQADFTQHLNPESLVVVRGAKVEPSVVSDEVGPRYQFERTGYFVRDLDARPGALVFNRTVTLKDTWAKVKDR